MADFTPYAITLGATDYPSKYAGLLGYLDTLISPLTGRNKIINGKMEVAQRGTSFTGIGAAGGYTLDRWFIDNNTDGAVTISQQPDVPSSNEFQNSLRVAVTAADTSIAAGQNNRISQKIEGYNARDLIGRTFTISFWVRSSKTGAHCVGLRNSGPDRSYVAEYTISAANTWEFKSVTVSGGLITAGTWNWTNGTGISVEWSLACGTTFQTTAGAWQTGNFFATSNQVNCLDAVNNIFAITGVQLEVGGVATPFEHRPIGVERSLCERYAWSFGAGETQGGVAFSTTQVYQRAIAPQTMRADPTYSIITAGSFQVSDDFSADFTATSVGIVSTAVRGRFVRLYLSGFTGLTVGRFYGGVANGSAVFLGSAEL